MVNETKEARRGWILALVVALGGMALAFGFKTPEARISHIEAKAEMLESRLDRIDQKLDDVISFIKKGG